MGTDRHLPGDCEELLEHSDWLRRLARGLVRDSDAAEDLVQDTWVAALRRAPRTSAVELRAWLAVVARNFARRTRRDAGLRGAHEPRGARSEHVEGPDELAARVELQRALAEAVLALEGPLRSALVLRYFDGLSTIEVAERLAISHDAARQRISRGLAKLRARLDGEHGSRAAWLGALVPLAKDSGGLLLMSVSMKAVVLGAAATLALCLWGWNHEARAPTPELASSRVIQTNELESSPPSPVTLVAGAREPAAVTSPSIPASIVIDANELELTGEVLDAADEPVAGAAVVAQSIPALEYNLLDPTAAGPSRVEGRTTSDLTGRFRLRVPPRTPIQLEIDGGARGLAIAGQRHAGEHVIVHLAAPSAIQGRVTRATDGAPVVDARVSLRTHAPDRGETGQHLSLHREARSDAGGYYRIDGLPLAAYELDASAPGGGSALSKLVEPAPGSPRVCDFQIAEPCCVRGVVRDASTRAPIANAEVGARWSPHESVRTNLAGEYELHAAPEWLYVISARAPGYGLLQRAYEHISNAVAPPEGRLDFDLVQARRCKGIVLTRAGEPIEGAYVAACACEYAQIESIDWRAGASDAQGRFEIDGLRADLPHALFLRKQGFGTLVYEFPSGEAQDATIELGELRMDPGLAIAGRVVDDAGAGLAGLQIGLVGSNGDRGRWNAQRRTWLDNYVAQREGRSDHQGRFVFGELAPGTYEVQARMRGHNDPVRATVVLGVDPREPLLLVVPRGFVLEGVIEDREHRGVPSTYVSIEPETPGGANLDFPTDENGRFRAEGLPAGSYRLNVWPYANTREKPKDRLLVPKTVRGVQAGEKALVITLDEGAWLRGRVLDAQGKSAPNTTVQALDAHEQLLVQDVTNEDGDFELALARGDRCTLVARPPRPSTAYFVGWEPDPEEEHAARVRNVAGDGGEIVLKLPPR